MRHPIKQPWLEAPMWAICALAALLGWKYNRPNRRDGRFLVAAFGLSILCTGASIDWIYGFNYLIPMAPPGQFYRNFNSVTMELRGIGLLILLAAAVPYLWKNRWIELAWVNFYLTGRTPRDSQASGGASERDK